LSDNTIILSNHPIKEQMFEFITNCSSSAEENLLSNLYDFQSNSQWISENPKGVVRFKNSNCFTLLM